MFVLDAPLLLFRMEAVMEMEDVIALKTMFGVLIVLNVSVISRSMDLSLVIIIVWYVLPIMIILNSMESMLQEQNVFALMDTPSIRRIIHVNVAHQKLY